MRGFRSFAVAVIVGAVVAACSGPAASLPPTASPRPAATASPAASSTAGTVEVPIRAVAGPVCPVVTPSASGCDDRPVEGAELIVRTRAGAEVARVHTGPDGRATIRVPAGEYVLEPQPVEGLMGTAPPIEFSVATGRPPDELLVSYDTGIR